MGYKEDMFNPEGYHDPTAGYAIKNLIGGVDNMNIKTGDVVAKESAKGEVFKYLIVRVFEKHSIILRLTEEKTDSIHCTAVDTDSGRYYTDCSKIAFSPNGQFEKNECHIDDISGIIKSISAALELPITEKVVMKTPIQKIEKADEKIIMERDIYKSLYEELMEKVMNKAFV